MKLNIRELSTILAALRHWQDTLDNDAVPAKLVDIQTDSGSVKPLSSSDIDTLCEWLNSH